MGGVRQGEDRPGSGPRARRADRRPEDPEDNRRDYRRRRDRQDPGHEDLPEHGPLDVLAAERRERDGRHGADLAVRRGDGLLLDRRLRGATPSRRRRRSGRASSFSFTTPNHAMTTDSRFTFDGLREFVNVSGFLGSQTSMN